MNRSIALLVLALMAAGPAHSEVYKCVDGHGRTTYQEAPCAQGVKGSRVELTRDNGVATDAPDLVEQWTGAAKQGQIRPGMPQRYVRDALGAPTDTRSGLPGEKASEVWLFRNPNGIRSIGFLDGRVVWERSADAPDAPPADTADPAASGVPERATSDRSAIAAGQDCNAAVAAAGSPERSEPVTLPAKGPDGEVRQSRGVRHVYASNGGQPPGSMAIVCQNGVVREVQRPAR